jgi:hypothetical protein
MQDSAEGLRGTADAVLRSRDSNESWNPFPLSPFSVRTNSAPL